MIERLRTKGVGLLWLVMLAVAAYAGKGEKANREVFRPLRESPPELAAPATDQLGPDNPPERTAVGGYTTLSGYWDYQVNGGAPQYLRINPTNGNIHVIMMVADDSSNTSPSRRTAYAFSPDGGATWNNFNNVRVPMERSGYPSIDIMHGATEGIPVIANHRGAISNSTVYIDVAEGQGDFIEATAPVPFGGNDEPIWPGVAGAADGSVIMHASRATAGTNLFTRTTDFVNWQPWFVATQSDPGGASQLIANSAGRVATIVQPFINGTYLYESTNNGITWGTGQEIYPARRVIGNDTVATLNTYDLLYDGNNILAAIAVSRPSPPNAAFFAGGRIEFWSQATGIVTAVPWDSTRYPTTMVTQGNHWGLGYPALAKSGGTLVIVFMAFTTDTASIDTTTGRIFGELFYVKSTNNGATWSSPVNLTNTPQLDERYPSVSQWNPDGFVNIVWQEDAFAGTWVSTPDPGTPGSRCHQV